jgi:hypothetical protein
MQPSVLMRQAWGQARKTSKMGAAAWQYQACKE